MNNFSQRIDKFIEVFIAQNGYTRVVEGLQNTLLIAVTGLIVGIDTAGHQRQVELFAKTMRPCCLIDKLITGMEHIIIILFNNSFGAAFVTLTHRSEVIGKIKAEIMFQLPIKLSAKHLPMFVFDNGGIGIVNTFQNCTHKTFGIRKNLRIVGIDGAVSVSVS